MLQILLNKFKEQLLEDGDYIEEEETEILQSSFVLMRFFRMVPKAGRNLTTKDLATFAIFMFPYTTAITLSGLVAININPKLAILDDILQCLSLIATGVNIYITIGVFMYKNNEIAQLTRSIGNFRDFPKPVTFDRFNRIANFITNFLTSYTVIAIIIFIYVSYLMRGSCLQENAELGVERICGLIGPAWLPARFNSSPFLEVVMLVELINCIAVCVACAVILTFICGLVIVFISRVRHFKQQMQVAFRITKTQERLSYLKYCVRYHVELIDLSRQLNECMSIAVLLQATFTAGVIAMVSFQFLMKPELKTLAHGVGWFLVLATLCFAGQLLIDETSDVSEQIYNTNWYEYEVETQKYALMIICRGNYYLFIDTMFLEPLGFATFAMAMQNTYSLLAILMKKSG